MDSNEFTRQESTETRAANEQVQVVQLETATFEPAASVEQSGDYLQSEAIQADFSTVVESVAAAAAVPAATDINTSKAAAASDEPRDQGAYKTINPATGQATPAAGSSGVTMGEANGALNLGISATAKPDEGGTVLKEHGERSANVDKDAAKGSVAEDGTLEAHPEMAQGGQGTVGVGKGGLPLNEGITSGKFARQAVDAIGWGTNGMISNKETGSVKGPGTNKGQSSSDGGPPVKGVGAGLYGGENDYRRTTSGSSGSSQGKEWVVVGFATKQADGTTSSTTKTTSQSCEQAAQEVDDVANMEHDSGRTGTVGYICSDGRTKQYTWTKDKIEWEGWSPLRNRENTLDGMSPTPYTGSGHWGSKEIKHPGTTGGMDEDSRDTGRVTPVVMKGGKAGGAGSNEPGVWDDGNFYGGMFGSKGPSQVDPDGFDYYTPDVPEDVLSRKGDHK